MSGLILCLLVQSSILTANPDGYAEAYKQSQASGEPLLVLVGADWCPGCRTMKTAVLPRLEQSGKLHRVNFAVVDLDRENALASQLMRGGTIPQLIVFAQTANGWHREQITGATSEASVEALLGRARQAQQSVSIPSNGQGATGR